MQIQPAHNEFGKAVKFFRPQIALQFQAVKTATAKHSTINIEMANGVDRKYDWDNKTTVQVTLTELPSVCAAFLGLIPSTTHKYHGEDRNKGYEIVNQAEDRKMSLFSPAGRMFFNYTPQEAFFISEFCLDALIQNFEGMSKTDLMNLLKQTLARPTRASSSRHYQPQTDGQSR